MWGCYSLPLRPLVAKQQKNQCNWKRTFQVSTKGLLLTDVFKKDNDSKWKVGKCILSARVWWHEIVLKLNDSSWPVQWEAWIPYHALDIRKKRNPTHIKWSFSPQPSHTELSNVWITTSSNKIPQKCLRVVEFPAHPTLTHVSHNDEEIIHKTWRRATTFIFSWSGLCAFHILDIDRPDRYFRSLLTLLLGEWWEWALYRQLKGESLDHIQWHNIGVFEYEESNRTIRSVSDSVYFLLCKKLNYKVDFENWRRWTRWYTAIS